MHSKTSSPACNTKITMHSTPHSRTQPRSDRLIAGLQVRGRHAQGDHQHQQEPVCAGQGHQRAGRPRHGGHQRAHTLQVCSWPRVCTCMCVCKCNHTRARSCVHVFVCTCLRVCWGGERTTVNCPRTYLPKFLGVDCPTTSQPAGCHALHTQHGCKV